ncbi:hypothetical protein DACRYDRAFT_54447 [Dacryopinax primogenitus]|uniref:Uncharacterized protein n=1 Tax=Dacryopinax primogenitus (strain DJM 731) TaxID=1858805 RepID=M5FVH3_DACPD|nr:uncharacterized protein DACRYDRAFT_54447 [Dacryopinax primogenitus]EJU00294.1 hypothetical protein DACRYDRAFT_54447 [Dacryopinax primogenitus]
MLPKGDAPGNGKDTATSTPSKEHSRLTSSLFSITDVFKDTIGRDGSKTVKFPEKLLKALDQKMQNIAMLKDPGYTDQLLRRTIAVFWGSLKDETFYRQMKENRKIEELILHFVTTATGILRKDQTLAPDAWKEQLNNQIGQFIHILRECLRTVSNVNPELTQRLDMYAEKIGSPPTQSGADGKESGHSHSQSQSGSGAWSTQYSHSVADMPLVKTVGRLFRKSDQDVQKDINALRRVCTEKAALTDLKTCLKNINMNMPFPGRRDDFDSEEAFHHWKTTELSQLSQLMVIMVQFNPELAKSTPSEILPSVPEQSRPNSLYVSSSSPSDSYASPASRHGSVSSRYSIGGNLGMNPEAAADALEADDETPSGHNFTYIPPNPKRYYKRLLELCLQYDLEAMSELPEDQEVSLGILSPRHLEVINECAVRWRIHQSYRVTSFLDIIRYKFEREEVPLDCVPEALAMVDKAGLETPPTNWMSQDAEYLASVYGNLFNLFLGSLYHTLDDIPALKIDTVAPYLTVLEAIQESTLIERYNLDIRARVSDIVERVKAISAHRYTEKMNELSPQAGVNRAMPLLFILDWMDKNTKVLNKRFPQALLGQIDIVALMLEAQTPMFLTDLEGMRRRLYEGAQNQPTPDVPLEDMFELFKRSRVCLDRYEVFCEDIPLEFDLANYFEPYVRLWLVATDTKAIQWVHSAITVDKFEPVGAEGHSSSIVDLFDSLKSALDFLLDLDWPDEYQKARFLTALAKSINKCIEQYCSTLEQMFMEEMFPRPSPEVAAATAAKQNAWLEKAKATVATFQGEKKVEPFNFQPASCVRLNNVEAARGLLDQIYVKIDADKVAETVKRLAPPVPEKTDRLGFLFTVKVVEAERLVPTEASATAKLDTFVTLSDERGMRLAKTRTIYESLQPQWDETFDITVRDQPLWLMASIRDRALIGKHDTVGRSYICLDPRRFGDFLSHEVYLDLDTGGRLHLRVSMEGEKDDIEFYFGRAFRSLKRTTSDMARVFVDKMAPFIRQSLSRDLLRSLVRPGGAGALALERINYKQALGGMQAFYRSAIGGASEEPLIPLPASERPRFRPEALSDADIEQVISPLFEYFEANLQILNTFLTEITKEMVMKRIWKEILSIIEGLLIPPLSDAPSDMKALTDKEVDVVFKWLKFLNNYFYAEGDGLPIELLQNQRYRDIMSIRLYYDWDTDTLMEECVRMMNQRLRVAPSLRKRGKSVYQQKNLGTIRKRKKEKREEKKQDGSGGETILRILRMRPNSRDFIAQQMQFIHQVQGEVEEVDSRGGHRRDSSMGLRLPPMQEMKEH